MATKRCPKCGVVRDASEFGLSKHRADGLRYECKQCRRAWEIENADRIREQRKQARERNADRIREQKRRYYVENAEQLSEKRKAFYQEHAEEIKAKTQAYRERNPEQTAQANRNWAVRNAAKVKQYLADWRQRNAERMHEWERNYRQANADKIRVRERSYYDNNPQKERQKKHARRARVRSAAGAFTSEQWAELKARYHHTCLCCGKREPEIQLTPDHVVSLKNGGTNDIGNIQPLCKRCNSRKGSRNTDYR